LLTPALTCSDGGLSKRLERKTPFLECVHPSLMTLRPLFKRTYRSETIGIMDNSELALIVGLGGAVTTALAGVIPAILNHRLEQRRLEFEEQENRRGKKDSERAHRIALADGAINSLTEFLGYADQLSRGADVVIGHHARSSRMKAMGQLSKYCEIASSDEIEAIRRFEETVRLTLEASNSSQVGRDVLAAILKEASRRSTLEDNN